ncbi:MAG: alpha/beta hydrolase [Alistipes sp.]
MRKILVLFALLAAFAVRAQSVDKQTFVYSIKGADTLRLDRYTASTPALAPRPCLLFVFGGGFVSGTRDEARYVPYFTYYAQQGYTVVSIDYRLGLKKAMADGTFSDRTFAPIFINTLAMATEDLYDATSYVCAQAAAWGVDTKQIVASGSSAGAITVLMGEFGICNSSPLVQLLPEGFNYAGVISFAGAILGMGENLTWATSPAPILLFHGDADRNVPYNVVRYDGFGFFGSKYIAEQLSRRRIPHAFYSVANTDHVMATRPMDDNRYEIDAFLDKLVLGRQPLIIDTDVTPLNVPNVPKAFTMKEYIRANFSH